MAIRQFVSLGRWAGGALAVIIFSGLAAAQPVLPLRPLSTSGTIRAVVDGAVDVTDKTGKSWRMKISSRRDGAVPLGGARVVVKIPVEVRISGEFGVDALVPGILVRFTARLSREGRVDAAVAELSWLDDGKFTAGVQTPQKRVPRGEPLECVVTGEVDSVRDDTLIIRLPRSRYARKGRLSVPLTKDAKVLLESSDLAKIQPGDQATKIEAIEYNTGDVVINLLEVRLGGVSEKAVTRDAEEAKYRELSDEPGAPRPVRGDNFVLHTDTSDRSAKMLLDKLESMIQLLSQYYGRRPRGIVECYVVRDLKLWPPDLFPPDAHQKIKERAGLTISATLNGETKSVVYACDLHEVVQHEAVHAYCNQTFGSAGPTWYAEGMAEMGRFWQADQLAVDVEPMVIDYLREASEAKQLQEIVADDQITGDSWEAYSWRWALCYLLAANPNYNRNFKALGLSLMTGQPPATFESVYGRYAKQLAFEYDQFVSHVGNGYRADLCAWQWSQRFVPIDKKGFQTIRVAAKAGWLPAGVRVEAGVSYEFAAKGAWKIDGVDENVTADGTSAGDGKLTAAVMNDYVLSKPIPLGVRGAFTAPSDGNLYMRCGEDWTRLGDNSGTLTVYLRQAAKQVRPERNAPE